MKGEKRCFVFVARILYIKNVTIFKDILQKIPFCSVLSFIIITFASLY